MTVLPKPCIDVLTYYIMCNVRVCAVCQVELGGLLDTVISYIRESALPKAHRFQ